MDISVIVACCGLLLSFLAFFLGQRSGAKKDGYREGVMQTALDTIKKDVAEIKNDLKSADIGALKADMANMDIRVKKLEDAINGH